MTPERLQEIRSWYLPGTTIEELLAEITRLQEKISTAYEAIKHGDEKHQEWLRVKLQEHFQ